MHYVRMAIEKESPEQLGYDKIKYNLTESSVRDRSLNDLGLEVKDLLLPYEDHVGKLALRELLASHAGGSVTPQDVLVTAGAAGALFIIATSLLEKGDHIVVARPNYATNIETPKAIECDISYLELEMENGFSVDLEKLESLIRPETRLVSLTCPHNPTGVVMSESELKEIISVVEKKGCRLLLDETYRELVFGSVLPVAATLSDRVISVSSMSKSYGIPGIRIGWITGLDSDLMHLFLCAKEQIGICGSVVDEHIAWEALKQRESWLPEIKAHVRKAFSILKEWKSKESRMEWVEPSGGVVCFPRIRPDFSVDVGNFYRILNEECGTYVGPGHWFDQDRRYMRVGYAWPGLDELRGGLDGLSRALDKAGR
ncbi:MAG: pyridoxal phosphate-dependent aminotransferase [Synergistota bacterium]|nr:pyridoxal phosphate-dependent aminotransferase [Synergistota bacterium]